MNQSGALILSEKIISDDIDEQNLIEELQLNFKSANGYSDLEISQKRSALDNVLIPDNLATHKQRLLDAGFSKVIVWQQCLNFISIIAIKWVFTINSYDNYKVGPLPSGLRIYQIKSSMD